MISTLIGDNQFRKGAVELNLKIKIEKNIPVPIYYQAVEQIAELIQKGDLKPFQQLPTEYKLSDMLGINRMTASRIYSELENTGLVQCIQGKGTFVTDSQGKRGKITTPGLKMIGLIVPVIDVFISGILQGIQDTAKRKGYKTIVATSANKPKTEVNLVRSFIEDRVSGLIIWPSNNSHKNKPFYFDLIKKDTIPFVFIDRYLKSIETNYVIMDNRNGAYEMVRHLIKGGHRRIAHITSSDTHVTSTQARLQGYKQALIDHNIKFDQSLLVKSYSDKMVRNKDSMNTIIKKVNCQKAVELLLNLKNMPTAIFAQNDYTAISTMAVLDAKGLKVPEDIAVAGYDNIPLTTHLKVPLTTVEQPVYDIGRISVEVLIGGNRKMENGVKKIVLPSKLIIRESSENSCLSKDLEFRDKHDLTYEEVI